MDGCVQKLREIARELNSQNQYGKEQNYNDSEKESLENFLKTADLEKLENYLKMMRCFEPISDTIKTITTLMYYQLGFLIYYQKGNLGRAGYRASSLLFELGFNDPWERYFAPKDPHEITLESRVFNSFDEIQTHLKDIYSKTYLPRYPLIFPRLRAERFFGRIDDHLETDGIPRDALFKNEAVEPPILSLYPAEFDLCRKYHNPEGLPWQEIKGGTIDWIQKNGEFTYQEVRVATAYEVIFFLLSTWQVWKNAYRKNIFNLRDDNFIMTDTQYKGEQVIIGTTKNGLVAFTASRAKGNYPFEGNVRIMQVVDVCRF